MKAGTTSVFEFLAAQPGVFSPRNKEPHYFTRGYRMPAAYYRWLFRGRRPGQKSGEASPTYSWIRRFPECPARIASDAPDVKLVYLVRDPVERVLSHHRHHMLLGQGRSGSASGFDDGFGSPDLWDRSRYRETIEAYLRHFPRERLFVADIDDLRRDDHGLRALLAFLDLDVPDPLTPLPEANASADRLAVPGLVGRLARTPLGSIVRDVVPRGRLQRIKGSMARPVTEVGGGPIDAAELRRRYPALSADVDAQYGWVRTEFLDR